MTVADISMTMDTKEKKKKNTHSPIPISGDADDRMEELSYKGLAKGGRV